MNYKGETFWQIHHQTVENWSEFSGFYWLIRYNALGQPTEMEVLPFQNCRLGKPDDNGYISKIHYNPFFGTSEYKGYNKKQTRIYDVFNPKKVKEQLVNQGEKFQGQVLFVGTTTALSPYYPVHEAYSAVNAMLIEAGVLDYHEDNISNGFLQPFMLIMKGDPNAVSSDPEFENYNGTGKPATAAQEFDEVISQNFMGAKRVGNMFVQWVNHGEEAPEAVSLPANNNGDLFNTLENQSIKIITIAWKVPAILANINEGVSLGGDGNAVRVAVKLMQQRVVKRQRILTDAYSRVLSIFADPYKEDITIVPYNPYPEMEVIDDKIWNELTPDERREWINNNTEIELITTTQPVTSQPDQEPPQARIVNTIPLKFTDKIKASVKKAVDYQDKMNIKCISKFGRDVSAAILEDRALPLRQIKRIHSFLKKNDQFKNSPFSEGCSVIMYNAWGGEEMFNFLDSRLKDIDSWLN